MGVGGSKHMAHYIVVKMLLHNFFPDKITYIDAMNNVTFYKINELLQLLVYTGLLKIYVVICKNGK